VPGSLLLTAYCELPVESAAHLHERFEDIERKLLGVDDIAEVVQRRAPLFHVIDVKIVLAQQVMGFLFRHNSPLSG
jgi:hypothetical protein